MTKPTEALSQKNISSKVVAMLKKHNTKYPKDQLSIFMFQRGITFKEVFSRYF